MTTTLRPTHLVDAHTRVERSYLVGAIERTLREYPLWQQAGDAERRRAARRFAFAMYLVQTGEINEAF